ncbi:50S ribosomal protein L9 [Candidatus Pelagibacter bacterium]|nr:50S ribosomal protein L9 [Candidatus Pelagibacter bacterium]
MELILLENILNLGNIGDKVKVKNGYGRNYLLKKGKALRFSKENQDFVTKKKEELNKKNIEIKNKFKGISNVVNKKIFTFSKESKENGDLYGSIKPKEISNLIKEKLNVEVSPSHIILKNNLDKIGVYKVDINFHSEVKAQISIKIDKIQSK